MLDLEARPAESFKPTTVTSEVQRVANTQMVTSYQFHNDDFMRVIDADAKYELDRHCRQRKVGREGFVIEALEEPTREIVESVWERDVRVRARRRWWQVLLFRRPMRSEVVRWTAGGYAPDATYYKVGWTQHVVECPPYLRDRVRGIWRNRATALTFDIAPPIPAWLR